MSFLGRLRTSINAIDFAADPERTRPFFGPARFANRQSPASALRRYPRMACPNERSTQSGRTRHLFSRNR
jgi:hypothetical protein